MRKNSQVNLYLGIPKIESRFLLNFNAIKRELPQIQDDTKITKYNNPQNIDFIYPTLKSTLYDKKASQLKKNRILVDKSILFSTFVTIKIL